MHIYSISLYVGDGGLTEYSVFNPYFVVVFPEKKTSSCKGYACTQLAYGIWAIVMFPLRILDFLPQVLVLFVITECVVDQFLKLIDMLGL